VLLWLRAQVLAMAGARAEGSVAQRVQLSAMERAHQLTDRIVKLKQKRTPDRKAAILILPPEGS
jgi:hypothetical protein